MTFPVTIQFGGLMLVGEDPKKPKQPKQKRSLWAYLPDFSQTGGNGCHGEASGGHSHRALMWVAGADQKNEPSDPVIPLQLIDFAGSHIRIDLERDEEMPDAGLDEGNLFHIGKLYKFKYAPTHSELPMLDDYPGPLLGCVHVRGGAWCDSSRKGNHPGNTFGAFRWKGMCKQPELKLAGLMTPSGDYPKIKPADPATGLALGFLFVPTDELPRKLGAELIAESHVIMLRRFVKHAAEMMVSPEREGATDTDRVLSVDGLRNFCPVTRLF